MKLLEIVPLRGPAPRERACEAVSRSGMRVPAGDRIPDKKVAAEGARDGRSLLAVRIWLVRTFL